MQISNRGLYEWFSVSGVVMFALINPHYL
jgi:hypothetical protein